MQEKLQDLATKLKEIEVDVAVNKPLAPFTTWKVGGIADLFVISRSTSQLKQIVSIANSLQVPVTVLGWGSNILISDNGIRGLVIRNQSDQITLLSENGQKKADSKLKPRLDQVNTKDYYAFDQINYEEKGEIQLVEIDSGVGLANATLNLIRQNITGMQWFAGIPGTIGGAIYNNIHGGSHYFEELVTEVTSIDKDNQLITRSHEQLDFEYDYSVFHKLEEVILSAKLALTKGDGSKALETYKEWATKKKSQPHNSAGCCFQNIDLDTKESLGLESSSWGYIIEHILGLKGTVIGKAKISPYHAAFIETEPGATAKDIIKLFDLIFEKSQKTLNIKPQLEIFFHGFQEEEISRFK